MGREPGDTLRTMEFLDNTRSSRVVSKPHIAVTEDRSGKVVKASTGEKDKQGKQP